jgi:hypothetical protein
LSRNRPWCELDRCIARNIASKNRGSLNCSQASRRFDGQVGDEQVDGSSQLGDKLPGFGRLRERRFNVVPLGVVELAEYIRCPFRIVGIELHIGDRG